MTSVSQRIRRGLVPAIVLGTAASVAMATPASADPPGNNGTVKIDDQPFDDAPDNEPHVECDFQIDFYGYDEGDYNATVTLSIHPPSGSPEVFLTDTIFIGEDAAGGGTDLDAHRRYNPQGKLNNYLAHPEQGYHVKLTVNAPFSQGADVKHKVFWISDCYPGSPGYPDGS